MLNLMSSFDRAREVVKNTRRASSPVKTTKLTTLKIKGYVELKRLGKGTFGVATLVERQDNKEHYVAKMIKFKHMRAEEKEYVLREVQTVRTRGASIP